MLKVIDLLVAAGANINARNKDGKTPLKVATSRPWARLSDLKDAVNSLIRLGADVNIPDTHKSTPLHDAVTRKWVVGVKILLRAGAYSLARDAYGRTPLESAETDNIRHVLKEHNYWVTTGVGLNRTLPQSSRKRIMNLLKNLRD